MRINPEKIVDVCCTDVKGYGECLHRYVEEDKIICSMTDEECPFPEEEMVCEWWCWRSIE